MVKIAVIGESGAYSIENTLECLLKKSEVSVFSYNDNKYRSFKQLANNSADVFIAPVSVYSLEKNKENIDIMVFGSLENNFESPKQTKALNGDFSSALNLINDDAIIIMNCDDKEILKYLNGSRARVLTYGFNGKASITASSVLENMDEKFIQICIQRRFTALNGAIIDVQEIPITLPLNKSSKILNEMAAIAASLCLGVHSKMISMLVGR